MCTCGCIGRADRYKIEGPDKSFYVISLIPACKSCYVGGTIRIELIHEHNPEYKDVIDADWGVEDLPWIDRYNPMVDFATGPNESEFVELISPHLVGLEDMDKIGAETAAEEMYNNVIVNPYLVKPQ